MIDHERKLVYVEIPGTASKAIRKAIGADPDKEAHQTSKQIIERWQPEWGDPEDYFWFTVIRHPYERLKSLYRLELMRDPSLLPYVFFRMKFYWGSTDMMQDQWFASAPDGIQVFKYEDLKQEWRYMMRQFDLPELPILNESHISFNEEDFRIALLRMPIYESYLHDVRMFGYEDTVTG